MNTLLEINGVLYPRETNKNIFQSVVMQLLHQHSFDKIYDKEKLYFVKSESTLSNF